MTAGESGGSDGGGTDVDYYAPETVAAARRRLEAGEGRRKVVAGGQSLSLLLRQGFVDADALVDVGGVAALSGVSVAEGAVTVGATTTYADLAAHRVSDRVAALGDACGVIADRQVRNLGTIGGALAHADPALDLVPVLLCLDAEVRIGSVEGERRLPLSEFLRGHMRTDLAGDELLEAVAFEAPDGAGDADEPGDADETDDAGADRRFGSAYEKHAAAVEGWATAGVAACVGLADGAFESVRVGLAAVADTAVRSPAVERELTGEPVTGAAVADASGAVTADIDPIDDRSGSAAYKRELAGTLVERALETAVRRAGGER